MIIWSLYTPNLKYTLFSRDRGVATVRADTACVHSAWEMSVSLHLPLPACILFWRFTFSINHVCRQLIFVPVFFVSFHHLHCFSVVPFFPFASLPLPFPAILSPPHRSATLPLCCIPSFILPSTLNPGTLLLSCPPPLFFSFLLPSIHLPTPVLWMYCWGRGSWCLSPGILGCCRGLQWPRQDVRAVRHHRDQAQPGWQRGLLEDVSPLLWLPRLPHEDHRTGACECVCHETESHLKRVSITENLSGFLVQFENLASILKLPGKKTFNNMDRDFLEKRKKDLNAYLQVRLLHVCSLVSIFMWRKPFESSQINFHWVVGVDQPR